MGRRKIEIQPLTDDRNRTVTFVKRKAGLFKKAYELAVLCQVDLAVIIVGNNDKVYEFSSVDTSELLKTYLRVAPHELKLPESYGNYKKRLNLHSKSGTTLHNDLHDVPIDDAIVDSDYDSDSPEPKRAKRAASPKSIYSKKPVSSRFAQLAKLQQSQEDLQTQRPVLRVQIPSNVKSEEDSAKTITALDTVDTRKDKLGHSDGQAPVLATGNATRYQFGKFKSPETKRVPQLPLPINQLQTLSPVLTTAPQLPSGMPFFSLLPQPLPQGQYPPAILPTPVFNQVFNQWQGANSGAVGVNLGQTNSGPNPAAGANAGASSVSNGAPGGGGAAGAAPGGGAGLGPQQGTNAHGGTGQDDEPPKFRHQFQQFNGDQTPMSALPSRYINDFYPSPSNLYPGQEWPTGMTPFASAMPHYFVSMAQSGSGATPLPMYTSARLSHLGPPQRSQFQPPSLGPTQPQGPEQGQFFKK